MFGVEFDFCCKYLLNGTCCVSQCHWMERPSRTTAAIQVSRRTSSDARAHLLDVDFEALNCFGRDVCRATCNISSCS